MHQSYRGQWHLWQGWVEVKKSLKDPKSYSSPMVLSVSPALLLLQVAMACNQQHTATVCSHTVLGCFAPVSIGVLYKGRNFKTVNMTAGTFLTASRSPRLAPSTRTGSCREHRANVKAVKPWLWL